MGVDEDQRDVRGACGCDATLHRGAERRFVDAGDRVVGADLQITSRAQPDFSALFSRSRVLTASSPPTPAFLTLKSTPVRFSSSASSLAG